MATRIADSVCLAYVCRTTFVSSGQFKFPQTSNTLHVEPVANRTSKK